MTAPRIRKPGPPRTPAAKVMRAETIGSGFMKYHLGPDDGRPWPIRPTMHHFTEPDHGDPHDHPWGFESIILSGSYVEEVFTLNPDGSWASALVHREAGTRHSVPATHIHRIVDLPDGVCWTLVMAEPWQRDFRFWRFSPEGVQSRGSRERDYPVPV